MNKRELESWALQIIGRVERSQPIEDARIELKSEWIDPKKAARRLAGHANAALGEPVMWLIGIDEKKGVIGAEQNEMADWWAQVKSEFDGVWPTLVDLNVPANGKTVVALYFETDRSPYVVKNPTEGPIKLEVPWREGTAIRTAMRSDLLRLLVPQQALPDFEILASGLTVRLDDKKMIHWSLGMTIYIEPKNPDRVVIPFHRCLASIETHGALGKVELANLSMRSGARFDSLGRSFNPSRLIEATDTEIICNGPGFVSVSASMSVRNNAEIPVGLLYDPKFNCLVLLKLFPRKNGRGVALSAELAPKAAPQGNSMQWALPIR
jgi:hypothetical protein